MASTEQFRLEVSFGDSVIVEEVYGPICRVTFLLDEFNLTKKMRGANAVRLWFEANQGPEGSVLMHSWIRTELYSCQRRSIR